MRSIIMVICLAFPTTITPMRLLAFCSTCDSFDCGGRPMSPTEEKDSTANDNQNRRTLSPEQKKAVFIKKYTETFNQTPPQQIWNVGQKNNTQLNKTT
jgi:hypothetical protein